MFLLNVEYLGCVIDYSCRCLFLSLGDFRLSFVLRRSFLRTLLLLVCILGHDVLKMTP